MVILCATTSLFSAIPRLISYQGVLTDELGVPVEDADHAMTFAIFDSSASGAQLWFENRPATTVNGVFDILLGQVTPLSLSFDRPYWLETVFGGRVLAPRALLSANAYSLRTADVEDSVAVRSLNGLQDNVFIRTEAGLVLSIVGDTLKLSQLTSKLSGDVSGATTDITADWTSYDECVVTINCSGPGIVVCESIVQMQISHEIGTGDRIQLCHSEIVNGAGPAVAYYSIHNVPAEFPSYLSNEVTLPVRTIFEITSAGTHTYYLNGRATQGVGGDRFWYASLTATFHPQHTIDALPNLDGHPANIEKLSR